MFVRERSSVWGQNGGQKERKNFYASPVCSRVLQDVVAPDPAPDDMDVASIGRGTVAEAGTAIGRPRHLLNLPVETGRVAQMLGVVGRLSLLRGMRRGGKPHVLRPRRATSSRIIATGIERNARLVLLVVLAPAAVPRKPPERALHHPPL